ADDAFTYGYYQFPLTLSRPGLCLIPLFFRPSHSGQFRSTATVFTNDPVSSRIVINLTGQAQLRNYPGGTPLWNYEVGDRQNPVPRVRALLDLPDITGDGLSDVIIADNNFQIRAFHAASTQSATPVWTYRTDTNPWRSGIVTNKYALTYGDDWDRDGIVDIVAGLDGNARTVIGISGRTGQNLWTFDTHHLIGEGGDIIATYGHRDFNGDGIKDIVAAVRENPRGGSSNAVFLINGSNYRAIWVTYLDFPPQFLVSIGDVTGDRLDDFVAVSSTGQMIAIEGGRGQMLWDGEFSGDIVVAQPIGDVNRDGSEDLYLITLASGIAMFNGSNGVKLWEISGERLDNLSATAVVNDINGNNSPDFIVGDHWGFLRAIDGRTGSAAWDTSLNVGSPVLSLASIEDLNLDGKLDFIAGLEAGRVFTISSNGRDGIWSFSNVHEGHGFELVRATRDLDGNGQMDVVAAMQNGTVYCFAGSFVGLSVPNEPPSNSIPQLIELKSPYPNPFNSSLNIPFQLFKPGEINLVVRDITGREVGWNNLGQFPIGWHTIRFTSSQFGAPLPSGTYFIELKMNDQSALKKILHIR
ncbi:MAG: PQQ-binding-like beta-propeller repeat protein, partial [bacterium]